LKTGCAFEQLQRGAVILPGECAAAGSRQSVASALGERLGRQHAKLSVVAPRLLEVVAEDLVHLGVPGGMLLEPESEALVELRARRFR
jgi:hypothetical protein